MRPSGGKLKLFVAEGQVVSSEGIRGSVATFRPGAPLAVFMTSGFGKRWNTTPRWYIVAGNATWSCSASSPVWSVLRLMR